MFSDLRYAFRQLVKNPGFAGVAILILGIGACTAIFSVVNDVLLRPLDFRQIVVIRETNLPQFPEFSVSPPNYLDWAKQTKSWQDLAAYSGTQVNLTGILLGIAAALTTRKFLASLLFGISPSDSFTISVAGSLVLLIALLACWMPARRASGISPMEAMRIE